MIFQIVPTLCVGMPLPTLCVGGRGASVITSSHAERGSDEPAI